MKKQIIEALRKQSFSERILFLSLYREKRGEIEEIVEELLKEEINWWNLEEARDLLVFLEDEEKKKNYSEEIRFREVIERAEKFSSLSPQEWKDLERGAERRGKEKVLDYYLKNRRKALIAICERFYPEEKKRIIITKLEKFLEDYLAYGLLHRKVAEIEDIIKEVREIEISNYVLRMLAKIGRILLKFVKGNAYNYCKKWKTCYKCSLLVYRIKKYLKIIEEIAELVSAEEEEFLKEFRKFKKSYKDLYEELF